MVKFYVDYAEEPLKRFDENCLVQKALSRIKEAFGIEKSRRCFLKLGNKKVDSKKQIADQIKKGDTLTLFASKVLATKRPNDRPTLTFDVQHNGETKQFVEFSETRIDSFMGKVKEGFKISLKTECHLELDGNALKSTLSLAADGVSNGSLLTLMFGRSDSEKEIESKVVIAGFELIHTSVKSRFLPDSISDRAMLYGIIDKLNKQEREMHQKPLSLYRYMGTLTFKSLEERFKEHCTPKTSKSKEKRSVFNPEQHCIIPIMEFTEEDLDERFDTPNEAAIAHEILSTVWRKECKFVAHFTAGTGCQEFNTKAFSKLTEAYALILAETMINAVRNHE